MKRESALDCIVIGAGMSGLTFATLMAQAGQRVLVIERHDIPGGLFTGFRRGPFHFNTSLEWTTDCRPGEPFYDLLARLELAQEYPFRKITLFKRVHSPELGAPLDVPASGEDLRCSLRRHFPHEGTALDRFLDDCTAVVGGHPRARKILLEVGMRPVGDMLRTYFSEALLIHLLCSLLGSPSAVGVLLMAMIGMLCLGQMYFPAHGDHRRLPLLLHRKIRGWGGEILYRSSVERILIRGGRVRGVRLGSGETRFAPLVVASVDAHQLYGRLLLPAYSHDPRSQQILSRAVGPSAFCLFMGLDSPLEGPLGVGYSHVLLADTRRWMQAPVGIESAPLRVEHQTALHPRFAPPGKSTLCVWASATIADFDYWGVGAEDREPETEKERYLATKERVASSVLDRVEERAANLRHKVEQMSIATPFTFRRYTGNCGGSVTGFAMDGISYLKVQGSKTPVENLYHIGHWTRQCGVSTAMQSAQELFDELMGGRVSLRRGFPEAPTSKATGTEHARSQVPERRASCPTIP